MIFAVNSAPTSIRYHSKVCTTIGCRTPKHRIHANWIACHVANDSTIGTRPRWSMVLDAMMNRMMCASMGNVKWVEWNLGSNPRLSGIIWLLPTIVFQAVGCDLMLGSPAREDKCRTCSGNGTSCKTIDGVLTMNDLQVGELLSISSTRECF